MPSWAVVILVLAILTYFYPGNVIRRRGMREFYRRPPADNEWSVLFPDRSPDCVREFLITFTRSFAIREKHWHVFRPGDRLQTVHRALNPVPWNMHADSNEYELFDCLLLRKYGVSLAGFVDEFTTLGDVFRRMKMA